MYNNPNILNVGWWWSSFISLSDLLALWNLQGLAIQLANKIPDALKGRKLVAMSDFGLSIPLVPTNPWIPPAISLSDVVHQEQHRSRFSNFTCGSVTLNSRWQLESPELNWTAADFIRQQQTLEMQGCQWYQECEETMKSSTTSMQASLHNKTSFRWTVFCSVDKMEVYNSSLWLRLPFPCFLAIKFWANKMEICTMGNLLTPGCICLLSRHYNLPAWWIYPLWMEWELQVLGVWLKLCASCQWESENIHLQGSTIACFKEDESHSSGAFHHTRGRNTHNMSHLSLSKLPRRSGFIINIWNSFLWREGGGRRTNGDILLQLTLWKVEYMLWVSLALAGSDNFSPIAQFCVDN